MSYYNNATHRTESRRVRAPSFAPPPIPPPPPTSNVFYDDTEIIRQGKRPLPVYEEPEIKSSRFYSKLPTQPFVRKYDLLFDRPQSRIVRFNMSVWLVWSSVFVVTMSIFVTLVVLRQYPEVGLTVAKNSAVLAVLTFTLLGLTIDRVYSNKKTWLLHAHRALAVASFLFALLHVSAHVFLLAMAFHETDDDDDGSYKDSFSEGSRYLLDRAIFYASGMGMLVSLLALLTCARRGVQKRRYNVFYYTHILGSGLFVAFAIVHSLWYIVAILYPVCVVYMPRVLRRCFVRSRVSSVQFGRDYALITLAIYRTWLNRLLLLDGLSREMCDVWLVCSAFGALERHPFTVLSVNERGASTYVDLLVWRYGDWKAKVVRRLAENQKFELYSHGLRVRIDESRTGDLMSEAALRSSNVLFILENAGISSFIAYANYLTTSTKTQDRPRNLVLHYRVEDTSILRLLDESVTRLRAIPSISVTVYVYTLDCNNNNNNSNDDVGDAFATNRIHTARLNYKRILKSFFQTTCDDDNDSDDAGANSARRLALENGSLYVYSNDEAMRERVVRQTRRWLRKGYYEGCEDNDAIHFAKRRKINIVL